MHKLDFITKHMPRVFPFGLYRIILTVLVQSSRVAEELPWPPSQIHPWTATNYYAMNQTGINLDHQWVEACDTKPPETRRHSALQKQLQCVFASRERPSDERNFCLLSGGSASELSADFISEVFLPFSLISVLYNVTFCSHSQLYKWMPCPDRMPCLLQLWEQLCVCPFVRMELQYSMCVCMHLKLLCP